MVMVGWVGVWGRMGRYNGVGWGGKGRGGTVGDEGSRVVVGNENEENGAGGGGGCRGGKGESSVKFWRLLTQMLCSLTHCLIG